jgi:hypothetical protein
MVALLTSMWAAPASAASAATDSAITADFCSVRAFTDEVDRTTKVSGGGWMTCRSRNYHIRLWVTLYRDGAAISTAVCEEIPSFDGTCDTSTTVTDRWAGNQRWQTRAKGEYLDWNGTKRTVPPAWSSNVYH